MVGIARTPYVELSARSAFSFGDGACAPEALARRAAELGYPALGLTDRADLGGVLRFAVEAERAGLRPIAGAELIVEGRPLTVLARDAEGMRNLAGLVTRSRVGGWAATRDCHSRGRGNPASLDACRRSRHLKTTLDPRVHGDDNESEARDTGDADSAPPRGSPTLTLEQLLERAGGLHLLTGPAEGTAAGLVRAGRDGDAARLLARCREAFGERMAVEVQDHRVSGEERALAGALVQLAGRCGLPWAVTNAPRYLDAKGRLLHDVQTALRAETDLDTAARDGLLLPNGEWVLHPPARIAERWKGCGAGLGETLRIADGCDFSPRWLRPPLPRAPIPGTSDDDAFLEARVREGARTRWGTLSGCHEKQLHHELGVIRRLGFAGFFLVMWDAVRFARRRGILCQGRGSAANSAVAYCLEITAVDPIEHGLLFERFLSEARTDGGVEAPDIDVDFEMERREEVLDYMYERYGRDRAAIACTHLMYRAPSAVQDAMRALGYPAEQAFALSKRVHGLDPAEGAEALAGELGRRFGFPADTPRGRGVLTAMRAMEGLPRLRGTHPGGFVLSAGALGDSMPIEHTAMGRTIVQFDKDDLDDAGVPKFDFLGLGGLSLIKRAFETIEARTGERMELYRLPTDDRKTYEMISRGDTVGTFQIESRAQIQSILHTRPERLYDLVVQVALIRPGPIQGRFVHPYTRRRRGHEAPTYLHPDLEPILRRTYGIPIFQEQAMAISMALGGYTPAEADALRRTMGHRRKLPRLQAALEELKKAILARGVEEEAAAQIVEDLHSFANYGFPESHAWSFALLAYATAYLKANHPADFYAAILNAWPMGFYPPGTLIHSARREGVEVRPPCLRHGEWESTLEEGACHPRERLDCHPRERLDCHPRERGDPASLEKRRGNGHLGTTLNPCFRRDDNERSRDDNERSRDDSGRSGNDNRDSPALRVGLRFIEGLGARTRDRLRTAREEAPFVSIDDVVRRARLSRDEALHLARAGAFEAFEPGRRTAAWEALRAAGDFLPLAPARPLPFDAAEPEADELVLLDYLATGISTRGHPMESLRARMRMLGAADTTELMDLPDRATVLIGGLVVARQHPETAKGTVFLLLEDERGFANVIVPAPLYRENREVVRFSPFLLIEGKVDRDDPAVNVVGRRFRPLRAMSGAYRSHDFH